MVIHGRHKHHEPRSSTHATKCSCGSDNSTVHCLFLQKYVETHLYIYIHCKKTQHYVNKYKDILAMLYIT